MSVAVHVTVVVPSGKVPPDPGHVTTAAPQLSLAVAENVADALWVPGHSTGTGAEHVIFGGPVSPTRTRPGHVEGAPGFAGTGSGAGVVPGAYGPGGDRP